jgi:hypothetical protein
MNNLTRRGALMAAPAALLWAVSALPAAAGAADYEFQLVENEIKKGDGAVVTVRLIEKRSKKPVSGAVIAAKRIDMTPDGMAAHSAPIEQLPATEPGVYRFKTDLSMEGRWQLSLAAKVQGEAGTVQSRLVLRALP